MPLSGIDIFKKLPKTNCQDCGVPTCMAFAMKLAAGQAELQRPERVLAGPVEEFVRARSYQVRFVELLHHTHLRAPFFHA